MKTHWTFVLSLITGLTLLAQSPRITFQAPALYPEGTAYDEKANVFYVSSTTMGTIGSVDLQGNYKVVYTENDLKSSFGMKVDPKTNTLWVCMSDPNYSMQKDSNTFKKMARVFQIDLAKGTKIRDLNLGSFLPGKHFANDLTLDNKGNVYITDSYSDVIYKVDALGKEGVLVQNELFKSIDIGLNGIAWHPKGFLLVSHSSNGCIYKVDISDPRKISKVQIPTFFPGADGLLFDKKMDLILVQNKGVNKVFRLVSKDNWASARVEASTSAIDQFTHPTTATLKDDNVYVLCSKLNELQDSTLAPSHDFFLQVAQFEPIK